MNALFPAPNNISWNKRGQALKPEASPLALAVAKLPRLDRLRRGLVAFNYGFGVFVHDRVFNGYTWNICIPESRKQGRAFAQFALHLVGGLARRRAR